jgi:hypothetical protein
MAPDKHRKAEIGKADDIRKPVRPQRRKLLQRRLDNSTDSSITAASHADDPKVENYKPPPREDRAG